MSSHLHHYSPNAAPITLDCTTVQQSQGSFQNTNHVTSLLNVLQWLPRDLT